MQVAGVPHSSRQVGLLLLLIMDSLRAAPLAPLLEFNLALDELTVFARPIIDAAALRAREFDELILRHSGGTIAHWPLWVKPAQ